MPSRPNSLSEAALRSLQRGPKAEISNLERAALSHSISRASPLGWQSLFVNLVSLLVLESLRHCDSPTGSLGSEVKNI